MSGTGEYLTLRSRAIRAREATLECVDLDSARSSASTLIPC